ncbi:MAG: hypothetical protein ACLFTW_15650 [Chitinispirillaceae bacterium]
MIQRNITRERCLVCCSKDTFTAQHVALLLSFGYEVEIVESTNEAIQQFIARKPSLLLVESSFLPRFSHRLIQLFKFAHRIPAVVLMAPDVSDVLAYLYLKEGVYEFVETPLRSEELALSIQRAAERLKVNRTRLFYTDLATQVGLALPVLGLLLYLVSFAN